MGDAGWRLVPNVGVAAQMGAKHFSYLVLTHAEDRDLGWHDGCASSDTGSGRLVNGLWSIGLNSRRRRAAQFDRTRHNEQISR
jgi:hypothetical protein